MMLIDQTETYAADIRLMNDGPIVFTFDNVASAKPIGVRQSGWSVDYFVRRGINVISFMETDGFAWYRRPQFLDLLETVSRQVDITGFERRISYGVSMGGYAAGAFSGQLRADIALMCVPFSTMNREKAPFEKRHPKAAERDWTGPFHDAAAELAQSGALPILLFDPIFPPDAQHMRRFRAVLPDLEVYRLPGAGHAVAGILNSSRLLSPFVEEVVQGRLPDRLTFARAVRVRRTLPRYYQSILSHANPHMNERRAVPFLCQALSVLADSDEDFLNAGMKYLQLTQGRPELVAKKFHDILHGRQSVERDSRKA